jgi:hypothetical protein
VQCSRRAALHCTALHCEQERARTHFVLDGSTARRRRAGQPLSFALNHTHAHTHTLSLSLSLALALARMRTQAHMHSHACTAHTRREIDGCGCAGGRCDQRVNGRRLSDNRRAPAVRPLHCPGRASEIVTHSIVHCLVCLFVCLLGRLARRCGSRSTRTLCRSTLPP